MRAQCPPDRVTCPSRPRVCHQGVFYPSLMHSSDGSPADADEFDVSIAAMP